MVWAVSASTALAEEMQSEPYSRLLRRSCPSLGLAIVINPATVMTQPFTPSEHPTLKEVFVNKGE